MRLLLFAKIAVSEKFGWVGNTSESCHYNWTGVGVVKGLW